MLLSFSRGSILAAAGRRRAVARARAAAARVACRARCRASLGAALVTAWAFGQSALTDDRVALAEREDAGIVFGLSSSRWRRLLLAAGLLIERRARTQRPLAERTRGARHGGARVAGRVPLVVLLALAFSDRGIGGTVSDRWNDLTSAEQTPQNDPGRLIETGNVRTIYWARAMDVWREHEVAGAGAGSFAQAQLRFRDQPTQGRHAHGYIHQTLADLGLLGLAAEPRRAGRLAVRDADDPRAARGGRLAEPGTPERTGLLALALVAVVFGVHSALDWTWFVPAVAITGLFCAGWVAGPRAARRRAAAAADDAPRPPAGRCRAGARCAARGPRWPPRRSCSPWPGSAVAVAQPWRADHEGDEALRCSTAATSRAPARRPTAPRTSTRCRPSPTSSAP